MRWIFLHILWLGQLSKKCYNTNRKLNFYKEVKKKRLAIGVDDFKKIIKEGCYYIDKTKFIENILEDGSGVKLINRPRRFGKTLNMTTLKYFFD